jgi:hypothetical protein
METRGALAVFVGLKHPKCSSRTLTPNNTDDPPNISGDSYFAPNARPIQAPAADRAKVRGQW